MCTQKNDGSFENPKHKLKLIDKEKLSNLWYKNMPNWTYELVSIWNPVFFSKTWKNNIEKFVNVGCHPHQNCNYSTWYTCDEIGYWDGIFFILQ